MDRLIEVLERFVLGDADRQDELIWNMDEENGFSVSSMYGALFRLRA